MESFGRTISAAGATFHAGIPVGNFNLAVHLTQDGMGTNQKTHPAPDTSFLIKL